MGSSINSRKVNLHLITGLFILVFVTNYLLQNMGYSSAFTRNYLDDLLAMPIILYIAQVILRLIYRNKKVKLDLTMNIYGFLIVSSAFEMILPKYFNHLTSDYWDIVCYAIGTFVFYYLNREHDQQKIEE